jgi:hypothetical protein
MLIVFGSILAIEFLVCGKKKEKRKKKKEKLGEKETLN